MVSTVVSPSNSLVDAGPGQGYDGVVTVHADGYLGTGVLLADGRAVLTAAHLLDTSTQTPQSVTVTFETLSGTTTRAADQILLHPDADTANGVADLALLWLDSPAPVDAERSQLYRTDDEVGQTLTLVGYGRVGQGSTGADPNTPSGVERLVAENRIDALYTDVAADLNPLIAWTPDGDSALLADFDDGTSQHDALGLLTGISDTGLGATEGLISAGDSGGPAFLDGQVVGIATLITSLSRGTTDPDVDSETNSSYGEIAFWQRISSFQQWIDESLRAAYTTAPATAAEVAPAVAEGDSGTTLTYFLVEFSGQRAEADDWISVSYSTRDGTAQAGSDYIATSGTLVLYPGETAAVIPVEVIGDSLGEGDEVFFLDITDPVGGSFAEGVTVLSAQRTILGDDGGLAVA